MAANEAAIEMRRSAKQREQEEVESILAYQAMKVDVPSNYNRASMEDLVPQTSAAHQTTKVRLESIPDDSSNPPNQRLSLHIWGIFVLVRSWSSLRFIGG